MMYNSPSEYLIAETEKFLGKGLTSEEKAKVNTAIRNIGEQLSEVDRYNWKEKLAEIVKNNNLGGVAVCLASSIVRQRFASKELQSWSSEILSKWKWADQPRIEKSAFHPNGHRTIIWDLAEKFIEMTSKKEQNLSDFYSCDTVHDPRSHRKETSQSDDKSRKDDYLSERVEHYLKEKDFRLAYFYARNADRSITPLDMMKEVVKMYGTDTKTVLNAVSTLTEVESETPDFTAKLLQDTMKTNEYKKAFNKEQGQSKATSYTK